MLINKKSKHKRKENRRKEKELNKK